jgi:hypothetical protein
MGGKKIAQVYFNYKVIETDVDETLKWLKHDT